MAFYFSLYQEQYVTFLISGIEQFDLIMESYVHHPKAQIAQYHIASKLWCLFVHLDLDGWFVERGRLHECCLQIKT